MISTYWKQFVAKHDLTGKDFELPEDIDLSGLGADFKILDESKILEEANDCYPGIVVSKDGFLPIASCLTGSGDYYFINTKDGKNGPLYRVYHDSVSDEGYDAKEAIVVVLKKYEEMLSYIYT